MRSGVLKRRRVAVRQIADMDVIPHPGAVVGIVVTAKNTQFFVAAERCLSHIGKQVVGNAGRVFPDAARGIGTDGIEVAQKHNGP